MQLLQCVVCGSGIKCRLHQLSSKAMLCESLFALAARSPNLPYMVMAGGLRIGQVGGRNIIKVGVIPACTRAFD